MSSSGTTTTGARAGGRTDVGVPALGLVARFFGVITSPAETFRAVVANPQPLGMLVLVTAMAAVFATLPMTSDAGRDAALSSQVEAMESFGLTINDAQYERMRQGMDVAPYTTFASVLLVSPLMTLLLAGVLYVAFTVMAGGSATFRQLFAVVAHASVITALQQAFTGPLNYARGAVTSATNLGVLLPMIDDRSFAGRALAMTDLFLIWWVLVLAIGLSVLYRRRTQPIALVLYGVYAVIVVGVAAVMSRLGGA
jgi:hypothetical protein